MSCYVSNNNIQLFQKKLLIPGRVSEGTIYHYKIEDRLFMKSNFKTTLGISLILLAIFMMKDSTYIFLKSFLVDSGNSIWFAVLFSWALIGTSFICGIVLLMISIPNKVNKISG